MRILLDECLPVDFRHGFPSHAAHTVHWAGLKGKKNGELLDAAEAAGYDVLITVDQGMPPQQRAEDRRISIILIRSRTNQIEDLSLLAPGIMKALDSIQPGEAIVVPSPA
jgi:predicted nuclease of predicted toxin-antitoxin system